MITWNRFHYAKRTIDNLLSTSDDFRLHWWDNGSTDGVAEYISDIADRRIVLKCRHDSNAMQTIPTLWFLEHCRAAVIGKVDDDTLVPAGWTMPIRAAIEEDDRLGMVGCWTYWPEDYERNVEAARKKIRTVGAHSILWNIGIGGTAFLVRKALALKFLVKDHNGVAFPVNRWGMSAAGYVSGWYFPLIWSEHMEDPRSTYCAMRDPLDRADVALTARTRRFSTKQQYQEWIMRDADSLLSTPTQVQIRNYKRSKNLAYRAARKIAAVLGG